LRKLAQAGRVLYHSEWLFLNLPGDKPVEKTLIIIKPDGVERALVGPIITRFEQRGLKLTALKLMHVSPELAREHYAVHEGKPFFEPLIAYITSAPVVVMVLEGPEAIQVARNTIGATKPVEATAGSIRGDFGLMVGRNLVHGSDSPENAAAEIALWFDEAEIISYERAIDRWILE
jgi:nucleoside-diphosphate kinase